MAVSLLKLQEGGGQLQQLAVLQGVLGLGAPPAQAPLGLLCPQQPAPPLQQQQSFAARADCHAVQLAAVIVLDSSTTDTQGSQWSGAATAGLGQHAWLGPGQADGLPGPLLGILAAPAQSTPQAAGSAPPSDAAAVAAPSAGDAAEQAAGSSNELHALRSMLAVLEQRWQQGGCGVPGLVTPRLLHALCFGSCCAQVLCTTGCVGHCEEQPGCCVGRCWQHGLGLHTKHMN